MGMAGVGEVCFRRNRVNQKEIDNSAAAAFSRRRWKRIVSLDRFLFHILYCVEAVILVGAVCLFYLCCGCHL